MLRECLSVDASSCVISSHLGHHLEQVTGSEKLEVFIVGGQSAFFALCFALPGNASEGHCAFCQSGISYFLSRKNWVFLSCIITEFE